MTYVLKRTTELKTSMQYNPAEEDIMDKNSKIYVAGHTGLVGSAFVRQLKSQGYTNLVLRTHQELDLLRQDEVERFF